VPYLTNVLRKGQAGHFSGVGPFSLTFEAEKSNNTAEAILLTGTSPTATLYASNSDGVSPHSLIRSPSVAVAVTTMTSSGHFTSNE